MLEFNRFDTIFNGLENQKLGHQLFFFNFPKFLYFEVFSFLKHAFLYGGLENQNLKL